MFAELKNNLRRDVYDIYIAHPYDEIFWEGL